MIAYVACAHIDRLGQAEALLESLPIDARGMVVDRGQHGELDNHDRAWELAYELAMEEDLDWCVVLEDDALPITSFSAVLPDVLDLCPGDGIVSLYTGTGRPPQFMSVVESACFIAQATNRAWLRSRKLLWGVAVAIPTQYVPHMLDFVRDDLRPYDYRLGRWAQGSRLPVWYTYPSMVDHSDGPTLINHQDGQARTERRIAHSLGIPLENSEWVDF